MLAALAVEPPRRLRPQLVQEPRLVIETAAGHEPCRDHLRHQVYQRATDPFELAAVADQLIPPFGSQVFVRRAQSQLPPYRLHFLLLGQHLALPLTYRKGFTVVRNRTSEGVVNGLCLSHPSSSRAPLYSSGNDLYLVRGRRQVHRRVGLL